MNVRIDTFAYTNRLRKVARQREINLCLGGGEYGNLWGNDCPSGDYFVDGVVGDRPCADTCGILPQIAGLHVSIFAVWFAPLWQLISFGCHDANGAIDAISSNVWGGLKLGARYVYLSRQGTLEAVEVATRSLACVSCLFFSAANHAVYRTPATLSPPGNARNFNGTHAINVPVFIYPLANGL